MDDKTKPPPAHTYGAPLHPLDDMQAASDSRAVDLEKVGICDLKYPIVVLDQENQTQQTVASISASVNLPHHFKGTHMSRFIEVLDRHRGEITMRTLPDILTTLRQRLDAESSHLEVFFPYFLERQAPQSGASALMHYDCWFKATSSTSEDSFLVGVSVPVTSLCPCSKAISDYGAHNQRGYIEIEVKPDEDESGSPKMIWLETLISIAESSGSAPVYPLLKRADERHVTMQAYDNPVFVEDMVRNASVLLRGLKEVEWFRVRAENIESIHNHSAFAEATS